MSGKKCNACSKTAYPQESINYDKLVFHTACFKCLLCRGSLTISNVAQLDGDIYCKNCFIQLFKRRGRYSVFKRDPATGAEVEVTIDGPEGEDIATGDATTAETKADAAPPPPITIPREEEKNVKPSAYLSGLSIKATGLASPTSPTSPSIPTPKSPTATTSLASPKGTAGTAVKKVSLSPKCVKCGLAAYPEESLKYDGILYHKACFKCLNCKSSLSISSVAQFQGDLYCKNCFVRMFKTRGTYNIFKKDGEPASPTPVEPASPTTTEPPVEATAALSISS